VAAERAYNEALAKARSDAAKIVAEAKAEIQKELATATAQADTEISAKASESEARIAEIRAGALEAVTEVAKDTAKELVAALGGKADARSVTAAVTARLKV
jgi:F-type H+-transporting ATPase subunit b